MRRCQLAWFGTAAVCIALAMSLPLSAAATVTATASFTTAGSYTFTVPAGVTSIAVTAAGAAGGSISGGGTGGRGAGVAATVPVTPGEQLVVGVGGVGGGVIGPGAGGAGGVGGGGSGASGASFEGAGGGGASVVGVASSSPGFGLLVVAAGGGGGGASEAGGDAGFAGAGGAVSGGTGTQTVGGTGGSGTSSSGQTGSFGLGAAGGGGVSAGGGGGGGYFGGGGGGGGAVGGGGGGGSTFVTTLAANVNGPTPTANPAAVTLTYAAPIADESTTAIGFAGAQPQGLASSAQTLTVTDDGSAPLVVSGFILGGPNPADYLVDNGCQQPVAAGASCTILIRFAPQAPGPSTGTLTLETNAVVAPPTVALSGTGGGAAVQGPTGPAGATGPGGSAGAPGKVRLVTCHAVKKTVTRKHKKVRVTQQKCTTKTVTGGAKFTTTGASERATLWRAGVVYARGGANASGAVVLRAQRPVTPGSYVRTLRIVRRGRTSTFWEPVTIG